MKRLMLVAALLALATGVHANLLVNGGFEDGLNGWTTVTFFGGNWQPFGATPYGHPVSPIEGSGMAGAISSWDTSRNEAYIYQQFNNPGGYTEVSFWGWARAKFLDNPTSIYDVGVQLGFDPLGSNDSLDPNIIWADPVWATQEWEKRTIVVPNAPAGTATVFIKSIHKWGIEWNVGVADDVQVVPEPGSLMAMAAGLAGMAGMFLRKR